LKLLSSDIAKIVNGRLEGPSDLLVTDIVTDTRQISFTEGLMFFALKGHNHESCLTNLLNMTKQRLL
jgi:UDP-N-acetylmuramyl pentapeptide synthase